ncbi:MAG: hypothetical protein KAI81_09820, partial [Candidatus Marinimicrobia bacterium]|nr:hypothetical protein [Candidatus Neomarinimicrobiota bacterium]
EISGKKDILVQGKRNNNLYHVQIIKEKENYTIICDCPTAEADQPCKHAIAGVLALSDLEKYGKWQNYRFHPFFLLINLFRKFTN